MTDRDVTPTAVIETRLVEADLGPPYRTGHDLPATTGTGIYPVYLRPHRVRVLYRRPVETDRLGDVWYRGLGVGWVFTQVIVIGRPVLALIRHECDGGPLPAERQRTFTDLTVAPGWVGRVVEVLAGTITLETEVE